MKQVLLALIRFYRSYISPARPPSWRFVPTSAADSQGAGGKYGAG